MKKQLIRTISGAILSISIITGSFAQTPNPTLPNFDEIIIAGSEDMSTYMNHYIRPFMNSFGTGIANGWYNTAATHQPLGFDLTFYVSLVSVPDQDLSFNFLQSEYNNLRLATGGPDAVLPTLIGGTTGGLQFVSSVTDPVTGTVVNSPAFNVPKGVGEDIPTKNIPVPMVQLAVGIIKNTELIVRYAPTVTIGKEKDFELKFFGIGVKHDFKQWIPGIKTVPIDLSILIGYTNLNTDFFFSNTGTSVVQVSSGSKASFDARIWTVQALVSKKISVLTVYGGIGYNSINSEYDMTGEYGFQDVLDPSKTVFVEDPVSLEFPLNGFRATAGLRLKFAIFTLHADYTLQEYNTLTVGFGFSVR